MLHMHIFVVNKTQLPNSSRKVTGKPAAMAILFFGS